MNFLNRNLYLLFACQTIFVSGSILLVTVGGIVGHAIAPDEGFATLPVALMVIGTAAATIPAAWMMQRKGRRFGFIFAAVLGAFGATLATYALHGEYFGLFCAATVPVGASLGFSQQFRFAAAESVQTHQVSHAVSFILLGSIAGAFLGPALVTHSADMNPDTPYSLAFSWLVGLYLLAVLLLRGLNFSEQSQANALRPKLVDSFVDGVQPSSMLTALRLLRLRPAFVTAVLAGVVGQGGDDLCDDRDPGQHERRAWIFNSNDLGGDPGARYRYVSAVVDCALVNCTDGVAAHDDDGINCIGGCIGNRPEWASVDAFWGKFDFIGYRLEFSICFRHGPIGSVLPSA